MKATTYKNYLLTVLAIILAFNYVDRLVLALVLQDIKVDLKLSDTELGLLTGIAFALFYAVMGIPIARWADCGNRVTIISVTIALWSAAVALCGFAATFLQLLAIRIAAAVGESGCIPPAHSLIAEYFTRAERPRAIARYMLGGPLSVVLGYLVAGWLNELYGWRATFIILGAPGLVLSVLAWFTLREPRYDLRGPMHEEGIAAAKPSIKEVCTTLYNNRTFRHLLIGYSVLTFFAYGIVQWQAAFFIRSYGLQTGQLGTWFTVIYGVSGIVGTYWGGEWASRRAAGNESLQLRALALAFPVIGLLSACIYLTPTYYVAFGLIGLVTLASTMTYGPLFATIQTLVPQRMRSISIAILYLFANLVGMGLGPLVAGALSDRFHSWAGDESLRYALLSLCPGYLWAAWYFWRASTTVKLDLERQFSADIGAVKIVPLGKSIAQLTVR